MKKQFKGPLRDIVLIGPGRWGNALKQALTDSQFRFQTLDAEDPEESWKAAFEQKKLVLIATPFHAIASVLRQLKAYSSQIEFLINASKGIDQKSLKTFSGIATDFLPKVATASLSGPSFAKELMDKKPTAVVLAGSQKSKVKAYAAAFSNSYFRVYSHADPVGVELCGSLKNVLAIACGICDGLNMGANARAALLSRGLIEMILLLRAFRTKPATALGLAGNGDLWLTATGDLSRNRQLGLLLAQGFSLEESQTKIGQPIEGLYTVSQVERIRKQKKLKLPICEQVFQVCLNNKRPEEAIRKLMTRETKSEEFSNWSLQLRT